MYAHAQGMKGKVCHAFRFQLDLNTSMISPMEPKVCVAPLVLTKNPPSGERSIRWFIMAPLAAFVFFVERQSEPFDANTATSAMPQREGEVVWSKSCAPSL